MANEFYELRLTFNCGGQYAENVYHYRIVDPSESNDFLVARQLVQALDDGGPGVSWISDLQGILSDDAYISTARAKRVAPTGGNTYVLIFDPTDFPGAVVSEIHSQQVAACLIWIATTDPDKTGRNFIPGIPESALDAGRWDGAYQGDVQTFITQHLVGFSAAAGVFLPCIYDRVLKTGDMVQDGYLSPKAGTQRRREVPI